MIDNTETQKSNTNTAFLLRTLFDILGDTEDYFISGSLSFLPLLNYYRQPGTDVDVSIRKEVYESRKERFLHSGTRHILLLSEVAVANKSIISRALSPRTGFIHYETPHGLLDTSLFIQSSSSIDLMLGLGFTLTMSNEFMQRIDNLCWQDITYRAAPPELMFVTKSVEYMLADKNSKMPEFIQTKHYQDLKKMATIVDWGFAQSFLDSLRVRWNRLRVPISVDNLVNPYRTVDLVQLRSLLS